MAKKSKPKSIPKDLRNKKGVHRGSLSMPVFYYKKCLAELGIEFRLDLYKGIQVKMPDKDWQDITNRSEAVVYAYVQENCFYIDEFDTKRPFKGVDVGKDNRNVAIDALVENNLHSPVEKYFNDLEPSELVKEYPNLRDLPADLISLVFQPAFNEDVREVIMAELNIDHDDLDFVIRQYCFDFSLLVGKGIYLRTMNRGTPLASFQFMPTLVGSQGCGKGTWIRGLLPAHLRHLIGDGFNLDADQADLLGHCQRHPVIECSELDGYHRKEISSFKAFIGGENTSARPKYGRHFLTFHRHFVIISTTNDSEFLAKDPTGTRRWVIMPVDFHREGGVEWTKTDVKNKMLATMDKVIDHFWQFVKHRVEVMGEDASYESWSPTSLKIREILCGQFERRPRTLEAALYALITPRRDEQDKTEKLTDTEKEYGIFFDVPPSSAKRSVMNLLPTNITSRFSKDMISKTMSEQGWTNGTKAALDNTDKRRILKLPPHQPKQLTVNWDSGNDASNNDTVNAQSSEKNTPCFDTVNTVPTPCQNTVKKHSDKDFSWMDEYPMTTEADDLAKERQSQRNLDNLYLSQKRDADKIDHDNDDN